MNKAGFLSLIALPIIIVTTGCTPPQLMVYSAGFSFSKYDSLVFGKPLLGQTTALYGIDIEIANLMARYNMTIVGDKEYSDLKADEKLKTLFVRFAISTFSKKENLITISFDDAVTGKTVASVTSQAKGNLYNTSDRTNALERVSKPLSEALTHEKGLKVTVQSPG